MKINKKVSGSRYEIIAMLTGASVLILEIIGSRLIAPYFGSSTYVWTAMIGVILGALSIGYWVGGKAADKDNPKNDITLILMAASILVALMTLVQHDVLELISKGNFDLRISALLAAIFLFGIPSALIGMISPHLAKIRLDSLKTSGETIGRLESASAIGSIAGVFLSGYFLLSYFGSEDISQFLAILLLLTSFLADYKKLVIVRLAILAILLLILFKPSSANNNVLLDFDSNYARYQVVRSIRDGKEVNLLKTDSNASQSGYFPDAPKEVVFTYSKYMLDMIEVYPEKLEKVLVIGGGAHTMATNLHDKYPSLKITSVEIDAALDDIAEEYFGFKANENIKIVYEDGRTFLNDNQEKYQVIVVDAYSSSSPPFHLSTTEAIEKMHRSLTEDGVIVSNIISRPDGLISSLSETYSKYFNVYIANTLPNSNPASKTNHILVATNNDSFKSINAQMYDGGGVHFTDDFAPIERLSY